MAGVLLVGLVVVELGGRLVAQRVATSALRDQGVGGATVVVGRDWWRPTLVPALLGGALDRVRVELRDTEVSGVQVVRADYVLDDLQVDPDPFGGSLRVTAVGDGSFRLVVAPESVADQLGVRARIRDGRLVVGPDDEPAKVRVQDGVLVVESRYLRREGISQRLAAIDQRALPCDPEVTVTGDAIELRCSGDRLPGVLDAPLGEPVTDVPAPTELEPPAVAERDAPTTTAAAGG